MADKNYISNIIFTIIVLAIIALLVNRMAQYEKSMTEVKNRIRVLEEGEVKRLKEKKRKLEAKIEVQNEEFEEFEAEERRIKAEIKRANEEIRALKEKKEKRQREDTGSSIKGAGGIVKQKTSVSTTE